MASKTVLSTKDRKRLETAEVAILYSTAKFLSVAARRDRANEAHKLIRAVLLDAKKGGGA